VEYINAFAQPQAAAGHLQFNQDVKEISKCDASAKKGKDICRYLLTVSEAAHSDPVATVNESETCENIDNIGKCAGATDMEGLVKKIAGLESTVRNGNLDVKTLRELLSSKEALGKSIGSPPPVSADGTIKQETKAPGRTRSISCSVLVMANGMHQPRKVNDWIHNLQNINTEYSDLKEIPREDFENRSVLILGAGNAATETADFVRSVSRDIQVVGRFASLRKMGHSHYVGDVRSRRTTHEDAFYMKSYEGVHAVPYNGTVMVSCGPDEDNVGFQGRPPVCTFHLEESMDGLVILAPVDKANEVLVSKARKLFGDDVYIRDASPLMKKAAKLAKELHLSFHNPLTKVLVTTKEALMKDLSLEQRKLLIELRDASAEVAVSGEEFRKPYDVVITAIGWKYDQGPFKFKLDMVSNPSSARKNDKEVYPSLNGEFESTNNKHLFVAGAAAHGMDRYRYKASGGFIHGFRFNCRTLYRLLEERYEAEEHDRSQPIALALGQNGWQSFPWNFQKVKPPKEDKKIMTGLRESLSPLWTKLLDRINDAAGPYEMVGGSLSDAIIYDCKNKAAFYLEDLTEDMVHNRYSKYPRLTWSYYYGFFHSPNPAHLCGLRSASAGVFSAFIHPVLQYFPPGVEAPGGKTFSQHHQAKYFALQSFGGIAKDEHPSSVWDELPDHVVKRMHLMEAYIFGDWDDAKAIRQLEVFMSHIENGAAEFCSNKGDGTVKRQFDEVIDINADNPDFKKEFLRGTTEKVCGGVLPQG
jgi:thioredoxin reductase